MAPGSWSLDSSSPKEPGISRSFREDSSFLLLTIWITLDHPVQFGRKREKRTLEWKQEISTAGQCERKIFSEYFRAECGQTSSATSIQTLAGPLGEKYSVESEEHTSEL